jgi:cell division protein FtsI/penicillin-binding protein 2
LEEKDALGTPILMGDYEKVESIQGRDVILTINKSIQYMAEKKIQEGVEKYDARSGTVIIMDPSSGGIIAMANYPSYSSETYFEESVYLKTSPHRKSLELKNLAISDVYEPGSVFKPLTIAAAIDLGIVTPETTYQDSGPAYYSTHTIDNWDNKHYGTMTIIQLLQKSNNIGAAWVGHQVGARDLHKYLEDFGIGSKSGISLEGEDTGFLLDYEEWRDINTANISFGQGVSTNSLQMLNSFNVFANGGYLLQPRIVSKIIDSDRVIPIPTKTIKQVIKKETADTMVMMLEKAAEGGEAQYFVLKNYRIAGKTGTAQIPEGGGYAKDRTNATFVGFDAGTKQFSMLVKLQEPKEMIYASETAVPIWMDIFTELVKFYGIAPDKEMQN